MNNIKAFFKETKMNIVVRILAAILFLSATIVIWWVLIPVAFPPISFIVGGFIALIPLSIAREYLAWKTEQNDIYKR